jgi:hypothetical protein
MIGEVTENQKKLRNEKVYNSFSSQNIITVINSRSLRWTRHVEKMRQTNAYKIALKWKGRIIVKLIRKKQIFGMKIGSIWLTIITSGEHDNERSDAIKGEEFLDRLSEYQLLKKGLFHGVY